jgi:hypothetical protein
MKMKVEEKKVIQVLQEYLKDIPFLQSSIITDTKNNADPDFQIDLLTNNGLLKIIGEYKENGQPRLARQAAIQIKDWLAKGSGDYGIFLAPYISPNAAKVCKQAGIGYADLAGNCLISFGSIYIFREGKPNTYVQRRELRSLYSPKSERVLRVLLTKPDQIWKTEQLAKAAEVSFGQVANVKQLLKDREWLDPNEEGIKLQVPEALLLEWAKQYRFDRNQATEYYAMSDLSECEEKFSEACQGLGIDYVFTAFSGAARFAPAVRYQRMTAYVEGDLTVLINSLGWKSVSSGANVTLLFPYDQGVFFDCRKVDDSSVATPVQIFLDLQASHGRGEEAAEAMRKVIEKSW